MLGGIATDRVTAPSPAEIGTAAGILHNPDTIGRAISTDTTIPTPAASTVQPSTTTAYSSAASNSGQPSGSVSAVDRAPVKAVASQVPVKGGIVPEVESSGPEVRTDGYENYTG